MPEAHDKAKSWFMVSRDPSHSHLPRLRSVVCVAASVFTVWALVYATAMYELGRVSGKPAPFTAPLAVLAVSATIYTILTPAVFLLALRYPVEKQNAVYRVPLYVLGGFAFVSAHAILRLAINPWYPIKPGHAPWPIAILFAQAFLYMCTDDLFSTYLPVVALSLGVTYYRKLRERETRMSFLETQLALSQLQAIKMQLRPHFLFNALHSISALMHEDVEAADKMMSRLSDLLRASLKSNNTQWTSLDRELEFIKEYLDLEQIRFSNRLRIVYEIDPEVLEAAVPHLLLQPLVENAIRHGTSKKAADGEIRLAARRESGQLLLLIADNGPGVPPEFSPTGTAGLGLKLTTQRLQALYDGDYQFSVSRGSGGGTVIDIRFPFMSAARADAAPTDERRNESICPQQP